MGNNMTLCVTTPAGSQFYQISKFRKRLKEKKKKKTIMTAITNIVYCVDKHYGY